MLAIIDMFGMGMPPDAVWTIEICSRLDHFEIERKRERETERDRERETERHREKETETEREREAKRFG